MSKSQSVRRLTISAIALALGTVLRAYSLMLPISGISGMRIGLYVVFAAIPAILFGPLWGGMTFGLCDVLSYFLNPQGAYLPWLTLAAILEGILIAYLWKAVKELKPIILQRILLIVFIALGIFGMVNLYFTNFEPQSGWSLFLSSIAEAKFGFITFVPLIVAVAGLGMLLLNYYLGKKDTSSIKPYFLKLLFVLITAEILLSLVNSYILIKNIGLPDSFIMTYLPRLIKEIMVAVVASYVLAFLLPLAQKVENR